MEEKGVFRSALGGFNKKDVLNYIDQITGQWNEERQALDAQAQESAAAVSAAAQAQSAAEETAREAVKNAEEAQERTRVAEAAAEELRQQLADLAGQLNAMQEQIAAATEQTASQAERVTVLEQENARLQEQITAYETQLSKKDGIRDQVDGAVRPLVENAHRQADAAMESVSEKVGALIAELTDLRESVDSRRTALGAEWQESEQQLSSALENALYKSCETAQTADEQASRFFR